MAREEFRALVENAPDAIVVSRSGIILYANAAAARLLGHDDVSELIGKPMTFLDRRSVEVMQRRIEQMAASGERLIPREYPARRRDGSEIMAEIASTIIEFDGAPAVLAYARDVTDRTRLRAQLAQADRLASLGMMAAGVAHEINNPLAVIGLAADGLRKRAGAGDAELVAEVAAGVERIAAIVRDLRSYGRVDDEVAGPVDLGAAITAAERLVAHEVRPRGKLVKEYGELPAVMGVGRHIEQVFVNLFLNAAHAMDDKTEGRIVVRAQVTPQDVVVSVEDDGGGIPKEMLDLVFEPFVTTRAGGGGTGLGLSISRDLVSRSGGSLVAKSALGKGTTMEVTLPRTSGARAQNLVPALAPLAEVSVRTSGFRVLIVDDEPLIVRALTGMLASRATVTGETISERALPLILADPPFDVIVCDVMMPGMTGTDLHELVAREKPGREERFVFITGGTYTARTRDYLERVPNARLIKPFAKADLLAAIQRVASR
jgi:two-component system, cell cycle sensor histidine kinase and response regulator CckA